MLEALERFKKGGYYSVNLNYGEGMGCDDMDVPMVERKIRLFASPIGVLGSVRVCWIGKVRAFIDFDFNYKPIIFENPPNEDQRRMISIGDYTVWAAWGDPDSIQRMFETWDEVREINK